MSKVVLFTHIDMDGYGCSVILQKLYPGIEVKYVDYGFDEISENITLMKSADVLLFTDISVSVETAVMLQELVTTNHTKVVLLDHHKSAEEKLSELGYDWIIIDQTKSGTLIVYDRYKEYDSVRPYKDFAELVSDYDLWEHKFEKSKLMQFLWSKDKEYFVSRFINNPSTQFTASENLMIEDSIKEYECSYELAKESIQEFVDCEGLVFGLVTNIGLFASLVADKIMKESPNIDYLVIISNFKLSLSFRSLRINVREIAEKLGGGGHDLASGCSYSSNMNIVDSIINRRIENYDIASFLNSKEGA